MNKITSKTAAIILVLLLGSIIIGLVSIVNNIKSDSKTYTISNMSTRDYNYEHYCDSMYYVNQDYYFDVIVESNKFNDYIEQHGEWWTN